MVYIYIYIYKGINMNMYEVHVNIRICIESIWGTRSVHGVRMEYVWNIYGIRLEYAWDMYRICMNIFQTLMKHVWNMYGICMEEATAAHIPLAAMVGKHRKGHIGIPSAYQGRCQSFSKVYYTGIVFYTDV